MFFLFAGKIFMTIVVFFLPGFVLSFLLFPRRSAIPLHGHEENNFSALDIIERITTSFFLSILISSSVVYALIFFSRKLGQNLFDLAHFLMIIGVVLFIGGIIAAFSVRRSMARKS